MTSSRPDFNIPVLTEVLPPSVLESLNVPAKQTQEAEPLDDMDWSDLENTLNERVLNQVMLRVDQALEAQLKSSLDEVIQATMELLAADLRNGLQQTIKDVVAQAVAEEIESTRLSKN